MLEALVRIRSVILFIVYLLYYFTWNANRPTCHAGLSISADLLVFFNIFSSWLLVSTDGKHILTAKPCSYVTVQLPDELSLAVSL